MIIITEITGCDKMIKEPCRTGDGAVITRTRLGRLFYLGEIYMISLNIFTNDYLFYKKSLSKLKSYGQGIVYHSLLSFFEKGHNLKKYNLFVKQIIKKILYVFLFLKRKTQKTLCQPVRFKSWKGKR